MAQNLTLKIITPAGLALEAPVETVVLKGDLGEFGVLAGHVAMVSNIVSGRIRYVDVQGGEKTLIAHGGISEVRDDTVTVLTQTLESPDEIDVAEAVRESEEIESRLESGFLGEEEHERLSDRLQIVRARAGM
ncbi:ATP synthase F1 subunit epsilon [Candidatus Mycalebacterium sp.]